MELELGYFLILNNYKKMIMLKIYKIINNSSLTSKILKQFIKTIITQTFL